MVNVIIEEPAFTIRITGGIGAQGSKGDPGNGIASAVLNDDYTLTLNFTDGTSYTTEPIRGAQGETGNGISSAVLNPDYTLTLYFTDGTHYTTTSIRGEQGERGEQGVKGDPGFSPIATVTKSGTVTTISITDANGTTTEEVLDGATGAKGDTGSSGVYIGDSAPTDPEVNVWVDTDGDPDAVVTDVKINGSSIVDAQGNANIPAASITDYGVLKVGTVATGLQFDPSGYLKIANAYPSEIKVGTHLYRPIVPGTQEQATFYGLAKIAGSDEKNSTLPVGTYTDAAKIAIQKMLGVYEAPWELIREDTFTNAEEADHVIQVDANGQSFELTDAILLFETPKQNNASGLGGSGIIRYASETDYLDTYVGPYTQEANASARGSISYLERKAGGLIITKARTQISSTNGASLTQRYYEGFTKPGTPVMLYDDFIIVRVRIVRVTGTGHYRLFGKRKWQ